MEPHEELTAMTGQPVERVLVDKATGIEYPVTATAFGEEEVTFTIESGDVIFTNPEKSGNLFNEQYDVKEVA